MATRDETVRFVYAITGQQALADAAGEMLDAAKAAGKSEEQIDALAASFRGLAQQIGDNKAIGQAIDDYARLAGSQDEVATAVERAGLSLKLATEQEQAAADALAEKNRVLAEAKREQADYAARGDRLVLVERELAAAVKGAAAEQKAANADWKSASSDLARATSGYEKTADAQARVRSELSALESTIAGARLSTSDLAGAQRELAARTAASEKGLEGLVREQHEAQSSAEELAGETRRFRAEQEQSAEAVEHHRQRMADARKETEDLGAATSTTTGLFGGLRSMLGKLVGFFSFASLVQGLRAVIGAGSDAEQTLGQIDAALESTGNKIGLTREELQALAMTLRDRSLFAPDQIIAAETRLLSYTDVAKTEFPRAMQIVIDQAQRLGMNVEQSAEVVGKALQSPSDAMSALSRQGFKLEDGQKQLLLQLEATGQTAQAQAIIMDMLAESYGGAAASARFNTFKGLLKGIRDQLDDFLGRIADSGAMDAFKARLKDISDRIAEMVKDGRAAEWAQKIADGVVSASNAMARGVKFIVDYAGAIKLVIESYLILRGLQIASTLLESAAAFERQRSAAVGASKATELHAAKARLAEQSASAYSRTVAGLTEKLKVIPQAIRFSIVAIGLELTLGKLAELKATLDDLHSTSRLQKEINADLAETQEKLREKIGKLKDAYSQYADVAIQSSDDLRDKSKEQLDAYQQQLDGARKYYQTLVVEARNAGDAVGLAGAKERIAEVDAALAAVNAQIAATTAVGSRAAAGLGEMASAIATRLKSVSGDAKETKDALDAIFTGFDLKRSVQGIGEFAQAFDAVAANGDKASETLRSGLLATLKDLSGEELLRFQSAASAALGEVGAEALKTSELLKATLEVELERLGVKAEDTGVKITKTGADTIATLTAVAENATATAAQIKAAFDAALGSAKTKEEAKALGDTLQLAYSRGAISARDLALASRQVDERIRSITANLSPLRSQFELLGIKSQAELIATRDNARAAFDAIVEGARRGEAAQEDVIRAFAAWAEAAKAAGADSGEAIRKQVWWQIEAVATAHNLSDVLDETGEKGRQAGEKTAEGFEKAKRTLGETAAAAKALADHGESAAGAVGGIGDAAQAANPHIGRTQAQIEGIVLLTEHQNHALRDLWEQFASGWLTVVEYGQRVKEVMDGVDDSVAKVASSISRFQDQLDEANAEIARLSGDQSADETLRHERRLRDLKKEYETSGEMSMNYYRQLVDAENKLHDLKLKNLREQSGSSSSAGSRLGGGDVAPKSPAPADARPPEQRRPTEPSVQINVQGSVIGGSPAQISEQLARLVKPELDRIARRSL